MRIIYWKTASGHEHSFLTEMDDWRQENSISPVPYGEIETQGEYQTFIFGKENTWVEDEKEYTFTHEGIKQAIKDDVVSIDDDEDDIDDLVEYAQENGIEFI